MRNWLKKMYLATYMSSPFGPEEPQTLASLGFKSTEIASHKVDENGFDSWVELNNWPERFPSYADQWVPPRAREGTLTRKLHEHYMSMEVGGLKALAKTDLIIDVAAAGSPLQEVLAGLGFSHVFKTDLNFRTDLDKKIIGGSGSKGFSYFDDESVSLMVAHNSIEHFERGEDIALFRAANRVLRIGGRFVWVPLGLMVGGLNETDPDCWESKYKNAARWPKFDRKYPIFVSGRRQRLMKWWDPLHLEAELKKHAPDCKVTIYEVERQLAGRYCLVLEKRA